MLLVFPTARLRKIIADIFIANPEDMLWRFVGAQGLPYPLVDLECTWSGHYSFLDSQESADFFTISLVFDGNDTHVVDSRVFKDAFFDLERENVLPA